MSNVRTRFQGSESPSTYERFVRFVGLVESVYGVKLSLPNPSEDLGKFCSGLVEGRDHAWRPLICGLSASSRFGLAHSLFLFRKVVRKEKPAVQPYLDKMSVSGGDCDPDFEQFAVRLTRRLFRRGWDRSYVGRGLHSKLTTTASAEWPRSSGGSRGWSPPGLEERASFSEYVLRSTGAWVERSMNRPASVVQAVETGGKWRVIACPPSVDNALRPLHHCLYDHLSQYKWLLRGDAKPERFKDFVTKVGEVFVSGDYESATDNLNSDLQKKLLETVFESSTRIPYGIRTHALSTYSSELAVDRKGSGVVTQRRGQLMGQLTSFPLLCLLNYITFRYSFRGKTVPPVRVNGDDIVFRAKPADAAQWERDVAKGGLKLSKGKTLIHRRGFTLNSVPFWSSERRVRRCGFIRASAIWKDAEISELIGSLNSRFYSCTQGFGRERKESVRTFFLSENSREIYASRRSVTRGLGMSCSESMLRNTRLFDRECFYLSYPSEARLPLARQHRLEGWCLDSSWRYTREEQSAWAALHRVACSDSNWLADMSPYNSAEELSDIQHGCVPYGLPSGRKYRKIMRLSRSECWKLATSRRDTSVFGRRSFRKKGHEIWVLQDCRYTSNRISCPWFFSSTGVPWAGNTNPVVLRAADGGGINVRCKGVRATICRVSLKVLALVQSGIRSLAPRDPPGCVRRVSVPNNVRKLVGIALAHRSGTKG